MASKMRSWAKIDDVIFDHSTGKISYVVVDTGGWPTRKKFLVPADRLRSSTEHENAFASELTKEKIESFPPYDEKHLLKLFDNVPSRTE